MSPGRTGGGSGTRRSPRLATALSDTSGTVLPNAMWKPISSSTGAGDSPHAAANSAEDGIGEPGRVQGAVQRPVALGDGARGGVVDHLAELKSSKKLPGFVLLMPFF